MCCSSIFSLISISNFLPLFNFVARQMGWLTRQTVCLVLSEIQAKGQATVIYCRILNGENRQYEYKDILFQSRHDTNSICCSNIHWKKIYDMTFFIPSSPNTADSLPNFCFLCIFSIKFIFLTCFPEFVLTIDLCETWPDSLLRDFHLNGDIRQI